jgi:hypothetical protein
MSVKHPAPARRPVAAASAIRDRLRRRTVRLGYFAAFLLLAAAALAIFAVCACKSIR